MFARKLLELDDFAERLVEIFRDGDRGEVAFVVAILNGYERLDRIDPVAKAAIAALETGDDVLEDVGRALERSGVVIGEFGFIEGLDANSRACAPGLRTATHVSIHSPRVSSAMLIAPSRWKPGAPWSLKPRDVWIGAVEA